MKYKNILLIDDDQDDQEIFVNALDKITNDLEYVAYTNASEALSKLEKKELTPDVIFLDLNMPIMSGQEFLKEIKSKVSLRQIPIIIFSTSSNPATIAETKELGAHNFITKPNKFHALVDLLKPYFE